MKRHLFLALARLLLAIGIVLALPLSHMMWGQPYPEDGQKGFGFIIAFGLIGFAAAIFYLVCGSLCQLFFRKRAVKYTLLIDFGLFCLLAGFLIYGGVTAQYNN